jgi:hypothetical protein
LVAELLSKPVGRYDVKGPSVYIQEVEVRGVLFAVKAKGEAIGVSFVVANHARRAGR